MRNYYRRFENVIYGGKIANKQYWMKENTSMFSLKKKKLGLTFAGYSVLDQGKRSGIKWTLTGAGARRLGTSAHKVPT